LEIYVDSMSEVISYVWQSGWRKGIQ
jgi:hypothetical protein